MVYLQEGKRESCGQGRLQTCSGRCQTTNPFILNKQPNTSAGHEPCSILVLQRLRYLTSCGLLKSSQMLTPGWTSQVVSSAPHKAALRWMGHVKGRHWEISFPLSPTRREMGLPSPAHPEARSQAWLMGTGWDFPSPPAPGGWAQGGERHRALSYPGFSSGHWAAKQVPNLCLWR